jgi:hypothetical protein
MGRRWEAPDNIIMAFDSVDARAIGGRSESTDTVMAAGAPYFASVRSLARGAAYCERQRPGETAETALDNSLSYKDHLNRSEPSSGR